MNDRPVLTVTELNEFVHHLLDGNPILSNVCVRGEISNFVNHYKTGHLYFTLKDNESLIKAVMFRSQASRLQFLPENGMKVILSGRVSVFVRDGIYQIYVDSMQPDGIGALYIAYEQLRRKLEAEGLFDESLKKTLPMIPSKIGIITSPTGAAIRDIINITGRRFPYAQLILYPSLVQGEGAAQQLREGIEYFSRSCDADVVIIGRGGGSLEDLWAFNDEALARTIRKSRVPVISAVGHETDFTICDFVADRRAPTPSAAAEIAVPDINELKRRIGNVSGRMNQLLTGMIDSQRKTLEYLKSKRVMTNPGQYIDDKRMLLLSDSEMLSIRMCSILNSKKAGYQKNASLLEAVNPLKIISRGYSAVFGEDGNLIRSVDDVEMGDSFRFRTSDGNVSGIVTSKEKLNGGSTESGS